MNPRQLRRKLEFMVKNFEKKREVSCDPINSITECEDLINKSYDPLIISQLKITLYGFTRLKSKFTRALTALFIMTGHRHLVVHFYLSHWPFALCLTHSPFALTPNFS